MANVPLKSLTLPGLTDTYTFTQVDDTLTTTGAAADAKKTGDEIADVKADLDTLEATVEVMVPGLTEEARIALLNCFEHVAWTNNHGQTYYDALESALYPSSGLVRIEAVFTQGSAVIYSSTPLNSLKAYLVVTGYYDDATSATITDYALSGTLEIGTSTITVTKEGLTDTFTVTVSDSRLAYEIANGTDLSTWIIDTEQHAYTLEEDFTILAKVSWTPSDAGMFLLDSQSVTGSVVGARIQSTMSSGNVKFTNQYYGGTGNSGAGGTTSDGYDGTVNHSVIYIMRNSSKTMTIKTYVDGTLVYEDSRTLTSRENTYPPTYYIGQNHAGTERPWLGVVDIYQIYSAALSDSEINSILGLT